jgi:hypothetical protein
MEIIHKEANMEPSHENICALQNSGKSWYTLKKLPKSQAVKCLRAYKKAKRSGVD